MAGRLWVFDLDNTLAATSRGYGYVIAEFIYLMLDAFGWRASHWFQIAELVRKIDNDRAEVYGAARHRFPGSLAICYEQLCRRAGVATDVNTRARVMEIGRSAFSLQQFLEDELIPGVAEALDFLEEQEDDLLILTKGDSVIQHRKWLGYGLRRWFPTAREFLVVRWEPILGYPGDKGVVLAELREKYPERKIYMVGDSVGSDMIPAAEAGVTPLHVPAYSKWGRGREIPSPPGTIELKKGVVEITERYDEL